MTGVLEVLAFPESFARLEAVFKSNAPLVLKGRVNVEEAGTRLAVMEARRLEDIGARPPNLMRVRVEMGAMDANLIDELKKLFAGKPGSCALAFELISSEGRWPLCKPTNACGRTRNWCRLFANCAERTRCSWRRAGSLARIFGGAFRNLTQRTLRKATEGTENAWRNLKSETSKVYNIWAL